MMPNAYERKDHERGIAIILALFLMSAASVLAASLMFLSQTETYATMNYRMMSQARYAGEAAVQKASDFLLDSGQYTIPTLISPLDPVSNYENTKSPFVCSPAVAGCTAGQPIILSAVATQPSNYPAAAVQTAFNAAAQGTLAAGKTTVTYGSYATLIGLSVFQSYGGTPSVIQTWQITGVGGLTGPKSATVEVVAIVETPKVPANNFAAFATANTCGAMHFAGNVSTDSYDSRVAGGFAASQTDDGGDVGTNGNLQIEGHVDVQGNLSSPRTGVGACTEGAVTALTETGSATVEDSIIQLPTAVTYPAPVFSATPPTTLVTLNAATMTAAQAATTCSNLGLTVAVNCVIDPVLKTLTVNTPTGTDVTLPSVSVSGGYTLILTGKSGIGQTVNINSLVGSGNVQIDANKTGPLGESVVLKVAGTNPVGVTGSNPLYPTEMDVPFDLSTMAWKQNAAAGQSLDAAAFQIVYGGHAAINMQGGNSQSAASIYAPNANFSLQGTQDLYGSILAATIYSHGTPAIHYDRALAAQFFVVGHPMVGTFSWKRY
jgi:hypothetical protein